VVAVCCLSFCVPEMILFVILFLVAIVEGDYQLIHGIERNGLVLFLVRYQILEVIWQPLIETIA